jgi:catechol 2,3-dioxygenase-like lactoylglutathione lyase family enzyme
VICKYIAPFMPDLHAAEDFYRLLFAMELLFRESELPEGWHTLPLDKTWADAEAAGIELKMTALRRDDFVLALFQGAPRVGTVLEVCLGLSPDEIDAVEARLPKEVRELERREGFLKFDDPFGFTWTLEDPRVAFISSGEIGGRWLEL